MMLRIGDFSRFAQVSVRLLRHYDQIGLLKPAHVDEQSGYRYYSAHQLPDLNHILAMRDLGLSLDQIGRMMQEKRTPGQMLEMLRWKHDELENLVVEEQARLCRLKALIARLEQAGNRHFDVEIKRIEALPAVSLHRVIPMVEDIAISLRHLLSETARCAGDNGAGSCRQIMLVFHDREYRETDIRVQAALPVQQFPPGLNDEMSAYLPEQPEAACCSLAGNAQGARSAYIALLQWIEIHEYHIAGPIREIYIPSTELNTGFEIIEVQIPIGREVTPRGGTPDAAKSITGNETAFRRPGHWHTNRHTEPDLADLILWPLTSSRDLS